MSETNDKPDWLQFLEGPSNNGLLLKGHLAVEAQLRALLTIYLEAKHGATDFASTHVPFSLRQLAELTMALNLLPPLYRDPLLALGKKRNKVAHDVLHEIDAKEAWALYYALDGKLRLDLPHNEEPSEVLTTFFATLLIGIESSLARLIAGIQFDTELGKRVVNVLGHSSPGRTRSHEKTEARMQELYQAAQREVQSMPFPFDATSSSVAKDKL